MDTPKFNYKRYLASREWALRKRAVAERAAGRCERCRFGRHDETHHKTYENIGKEPLEDLLAVCEACHDFLSGISDYDPHEELGAMHSDIKGFGSNPVEAFTLYAKQLPMDVEAVSVFNAVIQQEIEAAPKENQIHLGLLKLRINTQFDRYKRGV